MEIDRNRKGMRDPKLRLWADQQIKTGTNQADLSIVHPFDDEPFALEFEKSNRQNKCRQYGLKIDR